MKTPRLCGGRLRSWIVAAAAVIVLASPVSADRLLHFSVAADTIAGVRTAAVNADGMVVMRLRSTTDDGLMQKAQTIASRLNDLALEGLRPEQIAVGRVDGEWTVTGAGKVIVTVDAATATESGLDARSLSESWRARIATVLTEPYMTVKPQELLVVPYHESRVIRYGGTIAATPLVESMATGVARIERQQGRVVVHGAGVGTTVVVIEIGDARAAITVQVKKWAARIADRVVLTALPGGLPEVMYDVAVRNAVFSAADTEPRATVRVTKLIKAAHGYAARVEAAGVDYLPVARDVTIAVQRASSAIPVSRAMMISNYPERVTGLGALMRQPLHTGVASRVMWHHKNFTGRPVVVALRVVNAGPERASVRIGWAQAGPNPDEIFVGFNAMLRYWETVRRGAGFIATIPPGSAFETSAMQMGHHDVVSGLMKLLAETGSNLYVEMIARDPADAPTGFTAVPANANELPVTPYAFPAVLEAEVDYEVGGRFGHFSIGRVDLENEEGFLLAGAYGVSHLITVNASNPTDQVATLELGLRAGGGVARSVASIDGVINTSGVLSAGHEQLLERRQLPPGVTTRIKVEIIPTAGSNLPFTLIVRARTP